MLKLESLSKTYPGGQVALQNIHLEVPEGQIVAIIGSSGAGKSTLIRCINRLVEPTSGAVWVDERDITRLSAKQLRRSRRRIGVIFQEYALVERLTVMENVLAGQLGYVGFWQSWWRNFPQAIVNEAFRLLERVGLEGFEDRRADALSGGQRQRVGIARALLQNPKLLLVDEPTASLDPKTALTIAGLIRELAQERHITTLINIHNVALAKQFADRIVGLKAGEIVFDGTAAELIPATLAEIYGAADWETAIEATPLLAQER